MRVSPTEYIPQASTDRRPLVIWAVVATVSLILMAMITGAPWALASGHNVFAFALYGAFSHVCHQIPERSFFIAGHQFAVCARCTGLYAGFAIATLSYPLFRSLQRTDTPARRWLFMAAAPLAIDFSLGFFGLWENTHSSRFLTGALLGSVAVFYVMPGLVDLRLKELRQLFSRRSVISSQ
jgi:uncharacterized membrane protein